MPVLDGDRGQRGSYYIIYSGPSVIAGESRGSSQCPAARLAAADLCLSLNPQVDGTMQASKNQLNQPTTVTEKKKKKLWLCWSIGVGYICFAMHGD